MILPITLTIAGAAALLHIWLAARVSRVRRQFKIGIGDGGNEALTRRMRAHANFAENMPIFLILVGFIELATGGNLWLWGAALVFILARIAHAFGMDRASPSRFRMIGVILNTAVIAGLAGYAIFIAYQSPPIHRGFQIPPVRSAAAPAT